MTQAAPGKAYRIGMSDMECWEMFPDDEAAEKWFESQRWPTARTCPHCGSDRTRPEANRKPMPYRCKDCRRHFSVRTDTVMARSKIPLRKWAIGIYMSVTNIKGVSSMRLHRALKISQSSAWFMAHRIREGFWQPESTFEGPVEVDETYMGGKRKNMSNSKRKKLTGRGTVGKTVVVGVKDRDTNHVVAQVVSGTDRPTLQGFVMENVEQGATLHTDEHAAYQGMDDYDHQPVNHSVGRYVVMLAHTNGIESFWAMLKRAHKGTYHKMSPKHLQRYVDEFTGRHNQREFHTIDQMIDLAAGMIGKTLTYKQLTADNGLSNGAG